MTNFSWPEILDISPRPSCWAAYILGHNSFTARKWQRIFWQMPQQEFGTFHGVPLSMDQMDEAIIMLAPELNAGALVGIRKTQESIRLLHAKMMDAVLDETINECQLFNGRDAPGSELFDDLRYLVACSLKKATTLYLWLDLGRAIGAYQLVIEEWPSGRPLPTFDPIIIAAKAITDVVENSPSLINQIAMLALGLNNEEIVDGMRQVIEPSSRVPDYGDPEGIFAMTSAVMSLSSDIQDALSGTSINVGATRGKSSNWCHDPDDDRPTHFRFGPLVGQKKQLAEYLLPPAGKRDPRAFQTAGRGRRYWIVKLNRTTFEVWFRTQERFAQAKQQFAAVREHRAGQHE